MPDVPKVPGVPPLASYLPNAISLLARDLVPQFIGGAPALWGLFKDGVPVVAAENVASFDYRQSSTISDYPLEKGAFESYDKVATPFDVRLRFSAGGSEFARQALLDSVAAIQKTLDLFDAVTPEEIYESVNVVHYDYRRTSQNGVGLIVVDVWCLEVRETATAAFSNTKTPSGASTVSGGTVRAVDPAPAQAAKIPSVR